MVWLAGSCILTMGAGIGGLVWAASSDRYQGKRRWSRRH